MNLIFIVEYVKKEFFNFLMAKKAPKDYDNMHYFLT